VLIVGYGGADPHINAWLGEFIRVHGLTRRVVWISKIDRKDRFESSPDVTLMGSFADDGAPRGFKEHIVYKDGEDFQEHGLLRLIPSGFPLRDPALADHIVNYLKS
jgi:hypothetical protein